MEKIVLTDEELGSIKSNLLDAKEILDKLWNEIDDEIRLPIDCEICNLVSSVENYIFNALMDIETFSSEVEQVRKKGTLLAYMSGRDGYPSAEYSRELYMLDGKLILVSEDQDWIDKVDINGNVYYEEDWSVRAEEITLEEARKLWWDEITDVGREIFKGGVSHR